jgi:hypothetical protein
MNTRMTGKPATKPPERTAGELLILPDGRILAHHLSAGLARVLSELNPADAAMNQRAGRRNALKDELPN